MGKLKEYRAKRDLEKTPEPAGAKRRRPSPKKPRFVVQEHHARRLHWDFRLEKDGVLVSWAVPRGVPEDPKRNHLAVHVEDHPLDYIDFAGRIPAGSYGAGEVSVWDSGTYDTEKWKPDEVMVTLHGERLEGRYVLFQTDGQNWMMHRMDPPQDPEREPMPERVRPMLAKLAARVPKGKDWAYEFKWDGIRALVFVESGRVRVQSRNFEDITRRYPELRALGEKLGSHSLVLDGELVALDDKGVPRFERLQQRMGLNSDTEIRRRMQDVPVFFMIFDLLYDAGHSLMSKPYRERRTALDKLKLAGPHWQTPPVEWDDGGAMFEASKQTGLEGVVAKRVDTPYREGSRGGEWLKVKNHLSQELVIGGWLQGQGRRNGHVGALLVGYYSDGELVYAGRVGTGFTDRTLDDLDARLQPLRRDTSPFERGRGVPRGAVFVEPKLVGEFEFSEWTREGQLRQPSFKGLRSDKDPAEVIREQAV
ncbi:MAG TPA: non-homologous end-joining DNA ligase [Candidatus Dormibacteraeota bacterium]